MQKVFDSGSLTDRKSGDAQAIELQPGQDAPDLSYAAANGVDVLLYARANLATRDPDGDANKLADLADTLDLNRSPSPPIALVVDAQFGRKNMPELTRYAQVWADVIASRGYAPVIRSEADVVFSIARGGSYFTGAWVDAFELGSADGPLPDPATVPGLSSDVYPAWRAYRYTDGLSSGQDGTLGRLMPPVTQEEPPPDVVTAPAQQQPSAFTPAPAQVSAAELDDISTQIETLQAELAELRDEIAHLRGLLEVNRADPAAQNKADPAAQVPDDASSSSTAAGNHAAPDSGS